MMLRKGSNKIKKPKAEDKNKVENLYGVHFKYQDLFSRLVKVQKERSVPGERLTIPRMPSFDARIFRKVSNPKGKKEGEIVKKSSSSSNLKAMLDNRSISVRKVENCKGLTDRGLELLKSHSPNIKRGVKHVSEDRNAKKTHKKSPFTIRLSRQNIGKSK